MGVSTAQINISNLNGEFRFSVQHSIYKASLESKLGNIHTQPLKFFLKGSPQYGSNSAAQDFENEDDYRYIRITDIDSFGNLLMDEIRTTDIPDYDKYLLKDNDLLLARSGNTVGKSFLYKEDLHPKAVFAGYFIKFELNEDLVIPDFVFLYTKAKMFELWKKSTVRVMGQPNINAEEYKSLPIPTLDIKIQKKIVTESSAIQVEVQKLSSKIKEPLEIINEIFAREFKYSSTLWQEFGKGMTAGTQKSNPRDLNYYQAQSNQVALSSLLRFSTRFHNPMTQILMDILEATPTITVSEVITEKIHRGVQPKATLDGEVYAIKTGQLKNGYIDLSETDMVSAAFYEAKERARTIEGDILIASTGKVSLGKIDVVDFEDDAVVDGHISIVRVNERKYNRLFCVYFFRSILGAFQIERDYTGATNQIELYADQIEAFLIPDISLKDQQRIVDKIKKALDERRKIEKQIEEKQNEISKIIENAIKNSE